MRHSRLYKNWKQKFLQFSFFLNFDIFISIPNLNRKFSYAFLGFQERKELNIKKPSATLNYFFLIFGRNDMLCSWNFITVFFSFKRNIKSKLFLLRKYSDQVKRDQILLIMHVPFTCVSCLVNYRNRVYT